MYIYIYIFIYVKYSLPSLCPNLTIKTTKTIGHVDGNENKNAKETRNV